MLRLIELWPATPKAYADIMVQGLSTNSRDVQQGDVFIALQGLRHDARAFIPLAIAQAAVAVLCQTSDDTQLINGIPILAIPQLPQLLGDRFAI